VFIFLFTADYQGFSFWHGFRLPFDKLRAGIENPAKTVFAILFYPILPSALLRRPGYFFPFIIMLPEKTGQALCVNFALTWVFHVNACISNLFIKTLKVTLIVKVAKISWIIIF